MTMEFRRERLRLLYGKIETVYGEDAAPTSANSVVITECDYVREPEEIKRTIILPTLGAQPVELIGRKVTLSPKWELQGSGTPGTPPKWGPLVRACAHTEVAQATGSTQASPATAVGTPTGTFTYTATGVFAGTTDRLVTLVCTTAGGTGVAAFSVTAPAVDGVPAYSATNQVMTNATPFALCNAATITPAIGTAFALNDTFTIKLTAPHVDYLPYSGQDVESMSFRYNVDGTLHVAVGGYGEIEFDFSGRIPMASATFTAMELVAPDDAVIGALVKTGWLRPTPIANETTPAFTINGVDLVMNSLKVKAGNEIVYDTRVNYEAVERLDRMSSFELGLRATNLDYFDPWALAGADPGQDIYLRHGIVPGRIIELSLPSAQFKTPRYQAEQKRMNWQITGDLLPVAGDDEYRLRVR
ncbi:MAG: hypothetical protein ACT7A5_16055 [Ferrovibrionaceae bacterium]